MNFRLLHCSWTHQIEMEPDFQTNTICIEGNTRGLVFQRAQWDAAATERATDRFSKSSNSQCTEIFGKAPIIYSLYVENVFFIFLINKIFWVETYCNKSFLSWSTAFTCCLGFGKMKMWDPFQTEEKPCRTQGLRLMAAPVRLHADTAMATWRPCS